MFVREKLVHDFLCGLLSDLHYTQSLIQLERHWNRKKRFIMALLLLARLINRQDVVFGEF